MTTQTNLPETTPPRPPRGLVSGAILITIGMLVLIIQLIHMDWLGLLIPGALGAIFLVSGVLTRRNGLLIPGGILSGIGLGTLALYQLHDVLPDISTLGVFFVCFALGWGLITLLSAMVTRRTLWWPLIPGAILAAAGGALVLDSPGLEALKLLSTVGWPLILIAVGLYLIFRTTTHSQR